MGKCSPVSRRLILTRATIAVVLSIAVAGAAWFALNDVEAGALRVTQQAPAERTVALVEGWNLVGWTGEGVGLEALTAALPAGDADSLHVFDAAAQRYRSFDVNSPLFLNALDTLPGGGGLWVFAERALRWTQPAITTARSVALSPGFNLVTWTGPTATPIAGALAGLGPALVAAFLYEPLDGTFLASGPAPCRCSIPPSSSTTAMPSGLTSTTPPSGSSPPHPPARPSPRPPPL